jgi:hypothetical protein
VPFAAELALDTDAGVYRFYYASRGVVGLLKKLLKRAAREIIDDRKPVPQIDLELLERSFRKAFRQDNQELRNPFTLTFDPSRFEQPPPLLDDTIMLPMSKRRTKSGVAGEVRRRLSKAG